MISEEQRILIEKALEKEYLTFDDALDVYVYRKSASRSLKNLTEKGYLEKLPAPERTIEKKVWFPTEYCYDSFDF